MKRTMAIFGGTRGLGGQLFSHFYAQKKKYDVIGIGTDCVDIRDPFEVADFMAKNQPDIIIHTAAINIDGTWVRLEAGQVEEMVETNIKGFCNVLREGLKVMKDQKWGRFIAFSSILSQRPLRGTGLYSACKAFMDSAVKSAAQEMAKYDVTVNSLQLGYHQGGLTDRIPKHILSSIMENIPVKRLGQTSEIASTIEWLIDNSYVTGANIQQSGGLSAC